jgi:hypothetical protein
VQAPSPMADAPADQPTLKRQGLFPCEAELARRLSQSEKRWRAIAPLLEREGLPRIDSLMGGRFWPSVVDFFRLRHGVSKVGNVMVSLAPPGEENWDAR